MSNSASSDSQLAERVRWLFRLLLLWGLVIGLAISVWAFRLTGESQILIETFGATRWPRVVTGVVVIFLVIAIGKWRFIDPRSCATWMRRLFITGVGSIVFEVGFRQPLHLTLFLLALAWGYGLFAALFLLPRAWRERCPARLGRVIELISFQLCLFIVKGEFGLRSMLGMTSIFRQSAYVRGSSERT